AAAPAFRGDGGRDLAIAGGDEGEVRGREIAGAIRTLAERDAAVARGAREHLGDLGTHDRHRRAGGEQSGDFAFGDDAAANHDARAPREVDEEGIERHRQPSSACGTGPGDGSRVTAATSAPASNPRSSRSSWRAQNARNGSPG